MSFQPLHNQVMIQPFPEPEEQKIGSMYIPQISEDRPKPLEGRVISTGNGYRPKKHAGPNVPLLVKPGDRVLFDRKLVDSNFAERHEIDGQLVLLMPENHILAVIEE